MVLARSLALTIKLFLRRSCGLLVVLIDAILDEAATQLETGLITPPQANVPLGQTDQRFELQHTSSVSSWLWHGLFTLMGVLLGRQLPRAHRPVRTLRLV